MAGSKKKASSGKKKKRPSSSSKRTGANRKTAADTSSSASSSDAEGEPGGAKQPNPNAAVEGSTSAQDKVSSELDLSVLETVAERLHISRPSNDAKRIFSSNSVPRGGTATLGITYPPLLINTVDLCLSVCSLLAETQQDVAMDIEGVNLGRDGSICILQVACREPLEVTIAEKQVHKTNIFLFDICVLGKEGFEGGGLRHFLQDTTHLLKLFYDLRKDCDALFHIFQTKVCNVFDIQVLAFFRFCLSREQYLKMYNLPDRGPQGSEERRDAVRVMGLKKAMQKVLMPQAFEEVEKVKSEGTKLFVPELGGSYEVWNERPLNPVLVEYCANDVQLLFPMFDEWSNAEREGQYRQRQQNYQQNQHRSRSDNTKVQTFESRIERVKHLSQTRLEDTVTREEQWPQADSRWLFPDFEIN